ncbi:MAG: tetratricopeptide repeat protein [Myxococcaceae bacterium]|nr:tetratricopeptide repeat protein [Myxococcaceae bacterium]MCA3012656.1 tetratricopeptide repeat protein [Myxococcaceae bacterium]
MRIRLAVGGAVVLSMCCAQAWAAEPPGVTAPLPEVMKELRRIESAAWHGRLDAVRVELQNLQRARPSDPMLRVYVAWCSMPTDDAWNQLKGIAQMFPDLPWVHYGMGRIYVGWKMRDLATTALENALKKDPKFYPALVTQGDVLRLKDEFDQAEAKYRQALAIADDAEARTGLGLVILKQGKADAAKVELQAALSQWPDQPAALRELVKLLGPADPAYARQLATLGELQPKDRDVRRQLATLKFDAGDKRGALDEYEKLLKLGSPDLETAQRMQSMYRELGDAEGEERLTVILSGLDRDGVAPLIRLAELRAAKKDVDGAEKNLLAAVERNRERADTWLRLGRLSLEKNLLSQALERFRLGAATTTPGAEDCRAEALKLEELFKLPTKRAKGTVDRIYGQVAGTLDQLFRARAKANPKLAGVMKVRVKVSAAGVVELAEVTEDTVGDPVLAAHALFALREAEFEKKRREPVFEFELGPLSGGK